MRQIDLLGIDLLDTDLDLIDADIPSKYFVCNRDVKTCLKGMFKTCLQDVFKTCLEDVLKTSSA